MWVHWVTFYIGKGWEVRKRFSFQQILRRALYTIKIMDFSDIEEDIESEKCEENKQGDKIECKKDES